MLLRVKMTNIYEVPADKLNEKLAGALKALEEFKMPEWAGFVKTSVARMRPPTDPEFWYKRIASILRQIYIRGVIGVSRLRIKYGGKKERGMKPEEFRKGGGKIIRTILQQAEKAGFVEKVEGKKKGRQLTKKGLEFINKIAENIKGASKEKEGREVKGGKRVEEKPVEKEKAEEKPVKEEKTEEKPVKEEKSKEKKGEKKELKEK